MSVKFRSSIILGRPTYTPLYMILSNRNAEEDKVKSAFSVSGMGFYECERTIASLPPPPSPNPPTPPPTPNKKQYISEMTPRIMDTHLDYKFLSLSPGLGLPQVGMTATSPRLLDHSRSPTFFYTLTAEDTLARGMLEVAEKKGW